MLDRGFGHLVGATDRRTRPTVEGGADLPDEPGPADGGAADHHGGGAGRATGSAAASSSEPTSPLAITGNADASHDRGDGASSRRGPCRIAGGCGHAP